MDKTTFDPGPLAHVGCEPAGEHWTLVFIRDLPHPPEKVWKALTDPSRLAQWSPFTADRDLGETGDTTLTMIDSESPVDMRAVVEIAEAPRTLQYTWGGDVLRWELAPTGDGTRLTLRHTVEDQDWVPKVAAGWHLCLLVAQHLLDGAPIPPIVGEAAMGYGWQALADGYAGQLGVTGATGSE